MRTSTWISKKHMKKTAVIAQILILAYSGGLLETSWSPKLPTTQVSHYVSARSNERLERLPLNIMGRAIEKNTQSQSLIYTFRRTYILSPPLSHTHIHTHTCIYTRAHSDSADMSSRLVWVELEYPVWKKSLKRPSLVAHTYNFCIRETGR